MTIIYLLIGLPLCSFMGYKIVSTLACFIRWFALPFVEMHVVDTVYSGPDVSGPVIFRVVYAYEKDGKVKYYNKDTLFPPYSFLLGKKAIGQAENIKYDEKNDCIPESLGFGLIKLTTYIATFIFGLSLLLIYCLAYIDTGSFFWSP